MGTGFFGKVASMDPIAQAFHLPGSQKYAQSQASRDAGTSAYGPYTGVTPTLAAANAGYVPGGPGAVQGYRAWAPSNTQNWFQRFAGGIGGTSVNPTGGTGNSFLNPATNPANSKVVSATGYG